VKSIRYLPAIALTSLIVFSPNPVRAEDPPPLVGSWSWNCSCPGTVPGGFTVSGPAWVKTTPEGNVVTAWSNPVNIYCSTLDLTDAWGGPIACWEAHQVQMGWIFGLAVDSQGYIYTVRQHSYWVRKYDPAGIPLDSLFVPFYPGGVEVTTDGRVYLTVAADTCVYVMDGEGDFITRFGVPGSEPGQMLHPEAIAAGPTGDIFVSDVERQAILRFDHDGDFLMEWGEPGDQPGQFDNPRGLAVDSLANVYVADTNNWRVQKFDGSGNLIYVLSTILEGRYHQPHGVAVDRAGYIYVGHNSPGADLFKFGPPPLPTADPDSSTVSCLRICPAGRFATSVTVRDGDGAPMPDLEVALDFSEAPSIDFCVREGTEPYHSSGHRRFTAITDAAGVATFPLRAGGTAADSVVTVWAGDVLLARRPVASCDQNGDLVVNPTDFGLILDKFGLGLPDATADMDCDGMVSSVDLSMFMQHLSANEQCLSGTAVELQAPPAGARLLPTVPNPLRGRGRIVFDLERRGTVSVRLCDVSGRVVRRAPGMADLPSGRHEWDWDGTDDRGRVVPAGVYFVVLEAGGRRSVARAVMVK
jgi:streptogramin lyase